MNRMKQPGSSLNAERALDIILILGEAGPEGFSLAEISERVGGAKSATHRTLAALVRKGFAEAGERYGHYRFGAAIEALARRQVRLEPQIHRMRPGMTEFVRRTGFTLYLMIQSGVDAVCSEVISRFERHQSAMGVGARVPMGIGAGSLALLSLLNDGACDQVLAWNEQRYLKHPTARPLDASVVRSQVAEARLRGYAVNMGYYFLGQGGLGLPFVGGHPQEMNMAVSFSVPLELMTEQWIEAHINELANCTGQKIKPLTCLR
jgi:DNA-binding IclR family transcriptional regulator